MATSAKSPSRVHAIRTKLREWIFEGRFPPGAPLRELALARELEVSQATIREALQQLEHAGLVSRKANIGSTVTRLSPKDVRERVRLRASLEVTAAREAAIRMGDAEFAELERRLQVLGSAVKSDSYYEAAQADLEFHRYIWQCSNNDTLARVLEFITVPLFAFVSILRRQQLQQLESVMEAHEPLIVALKSRNPEQIRSAFEGIAVGAYTAFLNEGPESAIAQVFGFLGTGI